MRHPRLRRDGENTFYHCHNRVAGNSGDRPFGPAEKEQFFSLLTKLSSFYAVEVIAYQVLSNHFHLILYAPSDCPSPEETCRRFHRYYDGKRVLTPTDPQCAELAKRLRDVSAFMGDLQQHFTTWFNRTRPVRRRGALWAGRYKNTILELGLAVWDCWKYVEMNPVRAHITDTPANYRYGSFGRWSVTGRHPFSESIEHLLMPLFRSMLQVETQKDLHQLMRMAFAGVTAAEAGLSVEAEEAAIENAARPIPFRRQLNQRVRYWVDGAVIGSELFVTEVMSRIRGDAHMAGRRLTRTIDTDGSDGQLCCYKQLRALVG